MGMGLRIVDLLPALPEPNQRWLVLLGPRSVDQLQGVTWPNPYSRAARPWTGPPYPRAPRLGPRAFSVGSVVSFGVNCVCQHQLRERTFRSSSTNGCYAGQSTISLHAPQWLLF